MPPPKSHFGSKRKLLACAKAVIEIERVGCCGGISMGGALRWWGFGLGRLEGSHLEIVNELRERQRDDAGPHAPDTLVNPCRGPALFRPRYARRGRRAHRRK